MEIETEKAFVEAFVLKEKQERTIEMLGNPKKRVKALDRLNHYSDLNSKFFYWDT